MLRLYMAAYLAPPLNKDLWGHVLLTAARDSSSNSSALNPSHHHHHHHAQGDNSDSANVMQTYIRSNPPALRSLVDTLLLAEGL
jgi:hypothetical protein